MSTIGEEQVPDYSFGVSSSLVGVSSAEITATIQTPKIMASRCRSARAMLMLMLEKNSACSTIVV
jgi:hypothetical protein